MDIYQQYKNHELITPTLAPHSTYTVSIENLERVKKLEDEYYTKNISFQLLVVMTSKRKTKEIEKKNKNEKKIKWIISML